MGLFVHVRTVLRRALPRRGNWTLLIARRPVVSSARKNGDLPGSWRTPVINMLCSPTPQSRLHQTHTIQTMQPSKQKTMSTSESVSFRGSITQPVNTLCTLRATTQHSVPAGSQPLPGRNLTYWVPNEISVVSP